MTPIVAVAITGGVCTFIGACLFLAARFTSRVETEEDPG